MTTTTKSPDPFPYMVALWGSHPDQNNDDCWVGAEFASREEAQRAFEDPASISDFFAESLHDVDSVFLTADGPDIQEIRRLRPDRRPVRDGGWRREMAMEAGMLHGVEAYNEVLGY